MSRRRGGNNVTGPSSALTSFLQEQGITTATIARRVNQRQNQNGNQQQDVGANADEEQADQQPVAGPSTVSEANGNRRNSRRAARTSGYASDDLDADAEPAAIASTSGKLIEEEETTQPPTKKRKLTKAAEAKLKAAAKKRAKALKRGGGSEYEESDDEDDEDEFVLNVGGRRVAGASDARTGPSGGSAGASGPRPPVGSMGLCVECEKQFTFTKYTISNPNGGGFLCHPCAKASGNDPFAKKPAPKRRVTNKDKDKRAVQSFEERRFPTLVGICIDIISKHIDDIEAFGDLGTMSVDAISKALSKNRGLTPENAPLFYNVTNQSLVFYDATNLTPNAFTTLVHLNPNLTTLRLDFCGQMDNAAFSAFITGLPSLVHIELLGPFLVRIDAWKDFLKAHSRLEGFLITQSPRFDVDCAKALVACKGLKELRLKEIGKMDDEMLKVLEEIKKNQLTYLDISDPGNPEACTPEAIEALVKKLGSGLEYLDVSGHVFVDDDFLMKGLAKFTGELKTLIMDNTPTLTDAGVAKFFESWANPPLKKISFARNSELSSAALQGIIEHSSKSLEELNINGWKEVDEETLTKLGKTARDLRKVDVGWVRSMNDFVMKEWMEGNVQRGGVGGLKSLEELKVWGCNRITERCPKKAGLSIYGVETQVIPVR